MGARMEVLGLVCAFLSLSCATSSAGPPRQPAPVAGFTLAEIDEESVAKAIAYLEKAKHDGAPAVLLINSLGGSVDAGLVLAQHMETLGAPVTCVIDGTAASMAAFVLMSCDERFMTARSTIMIHQPSVTGLIQGNEETFLNIAARLHAITEMLLVHSARRMNMSVDDIRAKISGGREWWISSNEALRIWAVDRIVAVPQVR